MWQLDVRCHSFIMTHTHTHTHGLQACCCLSSSSFLSALSVFFPPILTLFYSQNKHTHTHMRATSTCSLASIHKLHKYPCAFLNVDCVNRNFSSGPALLPCAPYLPCQATAPGVKLKGEILIHCCKTGFLAETWQRRCVNMCIQTWTHCRPCGDHVAPVLCPCVHLLLSCCCCCQVTQSLGFYIWAWRSGKSRDCCSSVDSLSVKKYVLSETDFFFRDRFFFRAFAAPTVLLSWVFLLRYCQDLQVSVMQIVKYGWL